MLEFIMALNGPIVWAAHFFFLYLADALACSGPGLASETIRWIGATATVVALALTFLSLRIARATCGRGSRTAEAEQHFSFAPPLIVLSMVAILWTSIPLLVLPTCAPGSV